MTPIARLQRAAERSIDAAERDLELALDALVEAQVAGSYDGTSRAEAQVARLVSRVRALGELSGRMAVRWPRSRAPKPEDFATRAEEPFLGEAWSVAFEAAIRDLQAREPVGAWLLATLDRKVSSLYGPQDDGRGGVYYPHGFAAAQAATKEAAVQVQRKLVEGLKRGTPTEKVAAQLARSMDWSKGYARNVVRTSYNTATTAGRFREAEDLHASGVPMAFEFQAVMDSNTRPGHAAMNGLVAAVDDPIWLSWSPPLGYACRCTISPRVGEIPTRWARVPRGAEKDPGFGTRGDLVHYG